MRGSLLGIALGLIAATRVATADQVSPPAPVEVVRGVVDRVVDLALTADRHLVLVEWRGVAAGQPPDVVPRNSELVAFDAAACGHVYAMVEGDAQVAAALGAQVGQKMDGLLVPVARRGPDPELWCEVSGGLDGVVRQAPPMPDDLAALGELRDFFGRTSDLPTQGLDATPVDDVIEDALKRIGSDAALAFALDRRMYYFAADTYRWRSDASFFDTVERAVWSADFAGLPDSALMELYWILSPARAEAAIRAAYAREPQRAARLASSSPPWDEAIALTLELVAAERAAGRFAVTDFEYFGDERVADFLRAELARTPPPDPRTVEQINLRLDIFAERARRGVVDGASLARERWTRRDDRDSGYDDMYLTVSGRTSNGCDLTADLGAFELRVEADCDAGTLRHMFTIARGTPATAAGVIRRAYVGDTNVQLELEVAHVTLAPPPTTPITADAGAAAPTGTVDVEPRRTPPRSRSDGGCGCAAPASPGSGALLVLAVAFALGVRPRQLALQLAYSNVVMALAGVGYAAAALHLVGRPITFTPVLLAGLIVFVVYTIDKVALLDPATDAINDPDRTAFLVRWRPLLLAAAALSMLIGSILAARSSITCLLLFVLPIPIGLAYAIKFLPEGWRYRRLKDITGGKSGSVALTWGAIGGVMPLVYVGGVAPEPLLVAATYVCLRMFVNTAFFDIADLPGDRAAGTVTIPVALGLPATRRLLHIVNVLSVVVLLAATAAGIVTSAGYVIAIVGGVWGWRYVREARAEDSDLGFTCDVIADGDGVVLGVVAAILALLV